MGKKGQKPKNFDQLISLADRSPEERRRIARMGQEAYRKKKEENMQLQKCMRALLGMRVSGDKQKQLLKNQGFTDEDLTNKVLLMVALFRKGLTGDTGAIKQIVDMMDKLDMFNEGKNVTGQNITINLVPVSPEREPEQSEQEEKDIWNAENGLLPEPEDYESWDTDESEDWGNEVYEG